MRRVRMVGLACLAMLVLGVVLADAAFAASTVLPLFSAEVGGNGTSGASSINFEGTFID